MDPTARVPDQVRPSSPSPALSSSVTDPPPAPPPAATQPAEAGSQASLPPPQKPNPTISTLPPQNASAATASASAEPSRNTPGPTATAIVPSRKDPGVTTAAPSRNASSAASTAKAAPRRIPSVPTTTSAAASRNPSALAATTKAVPRNPSAPAATTKAVPRHPSVATAAVALQNPLMAAAAGGASRGSAPTRPEDYTPRMGMEFESEQEAYEFYRYYGWMVGFNVRKEYGNRSKKTGEITSRRFSCSREGYRGGTKAGGNKRVPMPDSRTGCHAHLIIRRRKQDSKLEVYVFEPRHNHPLFEFYRGGQCCEHRGKAAAASADEEAAGDELDIEDKVANIFWADGRMIVDYTQFGDVVAFDVLFQEEYEEFQSAYIVNRDETEQSSMPCSLSDASAQPGNALFQGIDLSNPTEPINYEGMHSGLNLSFTPDLGFVTYHTSQAPSNTQHNQDL
ncbi:hypothetical protein QOZ80_4AG0317940 [Eleusine coracana subsp. coracana]|nr:hypothetical protein QOZ80_4AG0317940 [Eleusine coracana subsp. coracana]